jgi:hypothetical protein
MASDRIELLRAQNAVTGIDFVYVHDDQRTLDVYFLNAAESLISPLAQPAGSGFTVDLQPEQIRVYSPAPAGSGSADLTVAVSGLDWFVDSEGRGTLRVLVEAPGGFAPYRLAIDDARLDPYYAEVTFSFKANCPRGIDCECPPGPCPLEASIDVTIDYRARDFWSMRRALLDFASVRYPAWDERSTADVGVMLVEVMAALGDEMAYYQDRVGREATLETATQRRSVRRHARLVDYTVHDGLAASTWIDVTVDAGAHDVPAGAAVWADPRHGDRVWFSVGHGLAEEIAGLTYAIDAERNALTPHIWDEHDTCLKVGATQVYVQGHVASLLAFDDPPAPADPTGRWVLLRTDPTDPAVEARRGPVRLTALEELEDPLIDDPDTGHDVTRLEWDASDALTVEIDLETLTVRGNLLPATGGATTTQDFMIGTGDDTTDPDAPAEAIERTGPDGAVTFLATLDQSSESNALGWLGDDVRSAAPEIHLVEMSGTGAGATEGDAWEFRRSFLGTNASQSTDAHFTLDDGTWDEIVHYRHDDGSEFAFRDYAADGGQTIRFGDGEFGKVPDRGTVFRAKYRLGNGPVGNVPADALRQVETSHTLADGTTVDLTFITAVTNPLPATGGLDPESLDDVRRLAPDAFRAVQYRAVRPEDYSEAVERLDWVQRAGTAFRWTGSWLAAVSTADPLGSAELADSQREDIADQLDRFRQTGRQVIVRDPKYADLDLVVGVCAATTAFPGDVREGVQRALTGETYVEDGYFSADAFTFGTPLYRSTLEAAIQAVPGVLAVDYVTFRRRGWFDWCDLPLTYSVADDEVIRVEQDLDHPDRGTVEVKVRGGA